MRFPFIDDSVVASQSEKHIWSSNELFLFIESFKSCTSCFVFDSDSEIAFLQFENRFLIICVCFVSIVFFRVCFFDLIYPIACLCGVITSSYLLCFLNNYVKRLFVYYLDYLLK